MQLLGDLAGEMEGGRITEDESDMGSVSGEALEDQGPRKACWDNSQVALGDRVGCGHQAFLRAAP